MFNPVLLSDILSCLLFTRLMTAKPISVLILHRVPAYESPEGGFAEEKM